VNSARPPSPGEQALIELSRWISRALQYSPNHPLCAQLAARTHEMLVQALDFGVLEVGILKDSVTVGPTPTSHPALKTRLGPYLHERGVVLLRIASGVRVEELSSLVDVLVMPPPEIFGAGGLRNLLRDRSVAHVQVDEIGHELSTEDRERIRGEESIRELFREMLMRLLAKGVVSAELAAHIAQLADHPDLAVRVIQGDPHVNLAEAVAGFALLLLQEEQRLGEALLEKMGPILMQFAGDSRDKILHGFPSLVGDFRQALGLSLEVLNEEQLASFAFPSLRSRARDLEPTFYALGLAAPESEKRMAVARQLAGMLYDLNLDERATRELLAVLAVRRDEIVSFASERAVIAGAASRILSTRVPLHRHGEDELVDANAFATGALERLALDVARDVVIRSSRMVDFDKLCGSLTAATRMLAGTERAQAIAGILMGLANVQEPRWKSITADTLARVARSGVSAGAIQAAERLSLAAGQASGEEHVEEVIALASIVAPHNAEPVLDLLERSTSRKLRRTLIDVLASTGAGVLPSVRSRLASSQWFVTRNMVILHARLGGRSDDLQPLAEHPHAQVRIEVLRALRGSPGDPLSWQIVLARLEDRLPEVAQAARGTLAILEPTQAVVSTLEAIAADDTRDQATRQIVVQVLGRSRDDASAEALVRLLQPHGLVESAAASAVRDEVARALRRCPAPAAGVLFEEALASPVRRVRKACERAAEPESHG